MESYNLSMLSGTLKKKCIFVGNITFLLIYNVIKALLTLFLVKNNVYHIKKNIKKINEQ